MKLAAKITLSMVALLGVLFALGGAFMIHQNHTRGLDQATARGWEDHARQKEALRRQLAERLYSGEIVGLSDVKQAGGALSDNHDGSLAILTGDMTSLYNSLPREFTKTLQMEVTETQQPGYRVLRFGGGYSLVLASFVRAAGQELWLISEYDITPVFAERRTQTTTFFTIYAGLLLATLVLVVLVARAITKPLARLGEASSQIAAGSYGRRTGLDRADEIGELARNFDDMAAAVEEKVAALELSVRQREDFMGAFTHELKTPMTAMMGYAALLKKGGVGEERRAQAIEYIHSETRRLEDLSQKMLMLLGLADEQVVLGPVTLEAVFAKLRPALESLGECEVQLPEADDIVVLADTDLLADLLLNLIQNAMRAGPADGCVRVELARQKELCVLAVVDTGVGIPPEELARVQEPFYRVDKSRNHAQSSNGLGLAICARIAQLHGTALDIDSAPERGTTVHITLRRADPPKEGPGV